MGKVFLETDDFEKDIKIQKSGKLYSVIRSHKYVVSEVDILELKKY